jgi:hypothetical protein
MSVIVTKVKAGIIFRTERLIQKIFRLENLYPYPLRSSETSTGMKNFRGQTFYSEALQDLFARNIGFATGLTTYLEVGSGEPIRNSNSFLLEKDMSFKGVSIELDQHLSTKFKESRRNPVICEDATLINYSEIISEFNLGNNIAYLQIDIDPAPRSLEVLMRMPFDQINFACITFEHDFYRQGAKIRNKQRDILRSFGYLLVCPDVKVTQLKKFEDWWINPQLIDPNSPLIPRGKSKTANRLAWKFPGIRMKPQQ